MAVQENGITIVAVSDARRLIRLWVGCVEISLVWNSTVQRFREVARCRIDGGGSSKGAMRIPAWQYQRMMAQCHAIAHNHGWK